MYLAYLCFVGYLYFIYYTDTYIYIYIYIYTYIYIYIYIYIFRFYTESSLIKILALEVKDQEFVFWT